MIKIAQLPTSYTKDQIKNEPMVFSASVGFALKHGGQITADIIESIEQEVGYLPLGVPYTKPVAVTRIVEEEL